MGGVFDEFGNAGNAGGDHGAARGHRFHEDDGDAFGKAGEDEEICGCVVLVDDALPDVSEEGGVVVDAEDFGEAGQIVTKWAIADEGERDFMAAEGQLGDGLEENGVAFFRGEAGDAEDVGAEVGTAGPG